MYDRLAAATGGFAADRRIGVGATGEVYRGDLCGEPIAVKRLKLPVGGAAADRVDLRRRFEAEVRALSRFGHPRIVRLLCHGVCRDGAAAAPFVIALEYLEGGSLADWLRGRDGAPPARAWPGGRGLPALLRLDIAIGAGVGLAYLHGLREPTEGGGGGGGGGGSGSSRVLHRDVKSANVGLALMGDAAYAKILDCGLAKALRGDDPAAGVSFTAGLAGTPGYMADEVARLQYTVASEVFSFGVVLFELFTGQCVQPTSVFAAREVCEDAREASRNWFRDGSAAAVACMAGSADAGVWPPAAAIDLAAIILDCVASKPTARPAAMGPVLDRLRALRERVVAAPPALVPCAVCGDVGRAEAGRDGRAACVGCRTLAAVLAMQEQMTRGLATIE